MNKKRTPERDIKRGLRWKRINNILPFLLVAFAAILTLLVYIRSLNGPLIFDDYLFIDSQRLKYMFKDFSLGFRKVADISFALNHVVSGMNLAWFRVTNIVLHILTAILTFYLTYVTLNMPSLKDRFGKSSIVVSSAVAVLFMLHPIQTSTVNYITQRMAIMAAMFSLLSLLLYAKATLSTGRKSMIFYALSALSFFLALFSKENAVMVLLVIPIYDLIFISSFKWSEFRKRFLFLSLLGLTLALLAIYKLSVLETLKQLISIYSNLDTPMPIEGYAWGGIDIRWTPIEYLLTELRIVSRYILLVLFPNPLFMVFDYSSAYPVSKSLFSPISTFFSLIFLVSLLSLSIRYIKKFPLLSFGILWYLITISLESFIAIGLDPYFEHRNYLPVFGIFLGLSSLLAYEYKFRVKKEVIVSIVMLVLFLMTFARNGVWTSSETLWKDAAKKVPENRRAMVTMSSIYLDQGNFREAEKYLLNARKIEPLTPVSKFQILFNLASVYKETNRRQEAKAILNELLSDSSLQEDQRGELYFFMGEIFREENNFSEARQYLEKAYEIRPNNPQLLISLGFINLMSGDIKGAEPLFLKSLEIEPNNALGHLLVGNVYMSKKDLEKAEKHYTQAFAISSALPKDMVKKSIVNLAQIYMMRGDNSKAITLLKRAIGIDPGFYLPYIFLGNIYLKMGDAESAIKNLEKALSLKETFVKGDPNTLLLYYNIGKAYIMKGDKVTARKNLEIFLSVAVSDKRLQDTVAKARREMASLR